MPIINHVVFCEVVFNHFCNFKSNELVLLLLVDTVPVEIVIPGAGALSSMDTEQQTQVGPRFS